MAEKIYEPKTKEEKKKFGRGGEKIYEPKTKKEKKDLAKKNLRKYATKPKLDSTSEDKSTSSKEKLRDIEDILGRMDKKFKRTGESKGLKKGGRVGLKSGGLAIRGKGCEIK
jgi:hypothetical protein